MKLAFSNLAWDTGNEAPVLQYLCQKGFTGLEIAPTKLFGADPYRCIRQAKEYRHQVLDRYGLKICSMQSLWYGQAGNIFQSAEQRQALQDYTFRAIEFAAEIGCGNLVFGNPKARSRNGISADTQVAEFFADISRFAKECGTCIALEPNPTIYGTDFITTTREAFGYCAEIPDLKVNADLGTLIQNQEDIRLIGENLPAVNHIHISEPYLKPIQHRTLHHQLKELPYDRYVSVEMGKPETDATFFSVIDYIAEVFFCEN